MQPSTKISLLSNLWRQSHREPDFTSIEIAVMLYDTEAEYERMKSVMENMGVQQTTSNSLTAISYELQIDLNHLPISTNDIVMRYEPFGSFCYYFTKYGHSKADIVLLVSKQHTCKLPKGNFFFEYQTLPIGVRIPFIPTAPIRGFIPPASEEVAKTNYSTCPWLKWASDIVVPLKYLCQEISIIVLLNVF